MHDANHHGLGPAYEIKVGDLRVWHVVEAKCFGCQRIARLSSERLLHLVAPRMRLAADKAYQRRVAESQRLVTLEPRLRCRECGARGMNSLNVRKIDRNA